jgi:hypothetical protein
LERPPFLFKLPPCIIISILIIISRDVKQPFGLLGGNEAWILQKYILSVATPGGEIMLPNYGGVQDTFYSKVVSQDPLGGGFRRPAFESLPDQCSRIIFDGASKGKEMEINSGATKSKEKHPWAPEKCIRQAPLAPKYVISTAKIEEQGLCVGRKISRNVAL